MYKQLSSLVASWLSHLICGILELWDYEVFIASILEWLPLPQCHIYNINDVVYTINFYSHVYVCNTDVGQ